MTRPRSVTGHLEGGGPVGCGCGVLLGAALGAIAFLRWDPLAGLSLALALVVTFGILGWRKGDRAFEKVLHGDPDGKPIRYWWTP